jgi:hypothetical protein
MCWWLTKGVNKRTTLLYPIHHWMHIHVPYNFSRMMQQIIVSDAVVEPCTRNADPSTISVPNHSLGSFSISNNSISFKTINYWCSCYSEARKTLIKNQRIKHGIACCITGKRHISWTCIWKIYYQYRKNSPKWSTIRYQMQMTGVREGAPGLTS